MKSLAFAFFFLTVIVRCFGDSECADKSLEQCMEVCQCVWCASPSNVTACVTDDYAHLCKYWNADVRYLAKDTEVCKEKEKTLDIVLYIVIPLGVPFLIIMLIAGYKLYKRCKLQRLHMYTNV